MALKYLKPQKSLVSLVTIISTIGVTLGVAVLIVVLSIMTGFDEVWRDRILGFNAHVNILHNYGEIEDWETICVALEKIDDVKAAAPLLDSLVLMQSIDRIHTPLLRGVDLNQEKKINIVANQIISGRFSLNKNELLVGSGLARRMNVKIGDSVKVIAPKDLLRGSRIKSSSEFIISGIFHMGMYDIDEGFAYTSLDIAQSLYNMESKVHSIQVMVNDPMKMKKVISDIREILGNKMYPQTWMEAHNQIFTALQIEKNMMFFLLTFVALVAAFSITNTLITLTFQKTHEIGLLKALGFQKISIIGIFIWMGFLQGITGASLGIVLALIILHYRNDILFFMSRELNIEILPPELYQLSQLPSHTTLNDISIVTGLVIIFCVLAGVVPAYRAARMHPLKALHFE